MFQFLMMINYVHLAQEGVQKVSIIVDKKLCYTSPKKKYIKFQFLIMINYACPAQGGCKKFQFSMIINYAKPLLYKVNDN